MNPRQSFKKHLTDPFGPLRPDPLGFSKSEDIPEKPDPLTSPDPESLLKKRQLQRKAARRNAGGRTSTILSESNTLG